MGGGWLLSTLIRGGCGERGIRLEVGLKYVHENPKKTRFSFFDSFSQLCYIKKKEINFREFFVKYEIRRLTTPDCECWHIEWEWDVL